jgi:hypothetical protein
MLKKLIVYSTCLSITGCQTIENPLTNISSNAISSSGCAEKPMVSLSEKDVETVSFNESTITKSGQVSANKNIGYTFTATTGQKLSYSTDADVCLWVFSPDNEILKGGELSKNGKYVIQVAAPKGAKTFDLVLRLENNTQTVNLSSSPIPTPVETTQASIISNSKTTLTRKKRNLSTVLAADNEFQSTPSVSDNINRLSPAKAIEDYYTKINNQDYQTAWDIYPTTVKKNKELHPDGYNSFIEWWTQVDHVNINKVKIEEENYDNAIVNISTRYKMKNGKVSPIKLKFYLAWNKEDQTWYVTKIKHK